MRIILVNQNYPPHSGYGGISVYLQTMTKELTLKGHDVRVIAGRYDRSVPEIENIEGVEVHRILVTPNVYVQKIPFLGPHVRGIRKLIYSWKVCRKIKQILSKHKIDIVEFADTEAEGFFYLKQKNRTRVVVRCHTPGFLLSKYYQKEMTDRPLLVSWLEKASIRAADRLSAPSNDMARQISLECEIPVSRINVIPNPVRDVFQKEAHSYEKASKRIQILHVGRMDRLKGIQILAEAAVEIAAKYSDAVFVFAGNDTCDGQGGTWHKWLLSFFEQKGILSQVTIRGFLNENELERLYAESDIAVIPSILYESFSYTCAQAMAAGIPSVASKIGGIPETVPDGVCGILVDPGNAALLSAAIIKLIEKPDLRKNIGMAARENFLKKFESKRVCEEMIKFYESVLKDCENL